MHESYLSDTFVENVWMCGSFRILFISDCIFHDDIPLPLLNRVVKIEEFKDCIYKMQVQKYGVT